MIGGLKSVISRIFSNVKNDIDDNFNKVAKNFAGSTPPIDPAVGMIWEDTSTNPSTTKKYNGTAWQKIFIISYIGATPDFPLLHECWIDTTGSKAYLKKWSGSEWETITQTATIIVDNILDVPVEMPEVLGASNVGHSLVYQADGKIRLQAAPPAAGSNAQFLNSVEIMDSVKTDPASDKYILVFNQTEMKYYLQENAAKKLKDAEGNSYTLEEILESVTDMMTTHSENSSAHHTRYSDEEARTAMGIKSVSNPRHHDRYTDVEARNAVSGVTVNLTDAQNIGGVKTFTSFPITPSTIPTSNYQTANKKYVDDKFAYIASDNILYSDDTEVSLLLSGQGYHTLKSKIMKGRGSFKISFDWYSPNNKSSIAKILINGLEIYDFGWQTIPYYITVSAVITPIAYGDNLSIVFFGGSTCYVAIKNLKIKGDLSLDWN